MRRACLIGLALCVVAWAAPALALQEGDFGLAPQAGMVTLPGSLGGLFAADFAYGAGVGYGFTNVIGLEADFLYSVQEELEKKETGTLTLTNFVAGIGPRFNWHGQYGVLYASLQAAVTFLDYRARWAVGDRSMVDEEGAHGFGGLLLLGGDVFIANGATLGLAACGGGFASNLKYRHLDESSGEAGAFGYVTGLLRFTILF